MRLSLLVIPDRKWSWYQKVWSLALVSLISIIHLFMPTFSYEGVNNLMRYDSMSVLLVSLTV